MSKRVFIAPSQLSDAALREELENLAAALRVDVFDDEGLKQAAIRRHQRLAAELRGRENNRREATKLRSAKPVLSDQVRERLDKLGGELRPVSWAVLDPLFRELIERVDILERATNILLDDFQARRKVDNAEANAGDSGVSIERSEGELAPAGDGAVDGAGAPAGGAD